jgi:hypothetical protein
MSRKLGRVYLRGKVKFGFWWLEKWRVDEMSWHLFYSVHVPLLNGRRSSQRDGKLFFLHPEEKMHCRVVFTSNFQVCFCCPILVFVHLGFSVSGVKDKKSG